MDTTPAAQGVKFHYIYSHFSPASNAMKFHPLRCWRENKIARVYLELCIGNKFLKKKKKEKSFLIGVLEKIIYPILILVNV